MSEIDRQFQEREARRAAQESERRRHRDAAASFLAEFFAHDVAASKTLSEHGIAATMADNRIVIHRTAAGAYADPFVITVGEHGEIDVAGRSLGRYDADDHVKLKRELTAEILTFFDL